MGSITKALATVTLSVAIVGCAGSRGTLARIPLPVSGDFLSENSIEGVWVGSATQDTGSTWTIEMQIDPSRKTRAISYPSLPCSGVLSWIPTVNRVKYHETITQNNEVCIDGGFILALRLSENRLKWEWYYPNGRLGASTVLSKKN